MTQENFVDPNVAAAQKLYDQGFFAPKPLQQPGMIDDETNRRIAAQFQQDLKNPPQEQQPTEEMVTPDVNLVSDNATNLAEGQSGLGGYGDMYSNQMSLIPTPGLDLQQQAVAEQAAVGHAKGKDIAAQYGVMQDELKRMDAADKIAAAKEQEVIDKAAQKYADEVERVAGLQVDPDQFWGDRSTGQKITAGISLFLGALGAARGGANRAVQVIDNAIERDIKAQQINISQSNAGLARRKGVLADMKQAFKDDRMAYLATKNAYLQRAQMEIQKIQSKFQGQEMAAKAKEGIGLIEAKKTAIQREAMATIGSKAPASAKVAPTDPKLLERWIPDYGYVNNANQVKPAVELISNMKDLKGSLSELIRIGEMSASERMLNKVQIGKDANLAQGMLVGALNKKITGGGPLSASELALVRSIVPDTSAVWAMTAADVNVLKKLITKIETNTWDKLRLYGITNPLDKYKTQDVE